MYPLLGLFQSAILVPDGHLRTLWTKVVTSRCGPVVIDDSGLFAEAQIYLQDCGSALLYMPLKSYNRDIYNYLSSPPTKLLTPYTLLEDELVCYDGLGGVQTYDLILQKIPQGEIMAYSALGEQLLPMIDELEREFSRIGFSHNNLTSHNIIVSNLGELVPIRCHFATTDGSHDDFDALRNTIRSNAILAEPDYRYLCEDCELYDAHQGYIRYMKDGLYGFKDIHCNDIIPAQFKWATDFVENRAIVETQDGYGVINCYGEFIVPPKYEILYYDVERMIFYYYDYDDIYGFDYNGRPISPDDPCLDDLAQYHYNEPFKRG